MPHINRTERIKAKQLLECLLDELEEGRKPLDMHGFDEEGLKQFVREALEKCAKEILESEKQ